MGLKWTEQKFTPYLSPCKKKEILEEALSLRLKTHLKGNLRHKAEVKILLVFRFPSGQRTSIGCRKKLFDQGREAELIGSLCMCVCVCVCESVCRPMSVCLYV